MFRSLYDRVLKWSRHPHAVWYLGGMSFAESSFFPVPPDVILIPMSLARPNRAMLYALCATLTSTLGGVLGYLIGAVAFDAVEPWIHEFGYTTKYETIVQWFDVWGVWAVFVAGFSPIPYKLFTISAGVLNMAILPFVLASFIGRGARFFLVSGLVAWGGERFEAGLRQHVERIGWAVSGLLVLALIALNL